MIWSRTAKFRIAATVIMLFTAVSLAWAASPAPANPTPSKEQREKMAQAHEKMATCLRSERPLAECHQEMMQACHDTMGGQGCGMMMGPGGMRGHGMMRGPGGAGRQPGATQP
jgi:hypothetical protein